MTNNSNNNVELCVRDVNNIRVLFIQHTINQIRRRMLLRTTFNILRNTVLMAHRVGRPNQ